MRRDPQFQAEISKNMVMRLVERVIERKVKKRYTDIDMVALFDKVMLHEV
jgi:hypothetical protein